MQSVRLLIAKLLKLWHWIFFFLFFVFLILGLCSYFWSQPAIQPLQGIGLNRVDQDHLEALIVTGQYKTNGEEFIVGETMSISANIQLSQEAYLKLKNAWERGAPKVKIIKDTVDAGQSGEEIDFESIDIEDSFVNPGLLKVTKVIDEKRLVKVSGDVIPIKEGRIYFISPEQTSDPIGALLRSYRMRESGVYVAPRHVKHQIKTNQVIECLTFIVVALAFLMVFFTVSQQTSKNQRKNVVTNA